MDKIIIYFDCDGVILNTVRKARELAAKEGYNVHDFWGMHEFYVGVDWNVLIYESGILNNAISKIRKLVEENQYEIKILTKLSGSDNEELAKRILFAKLLPGVEVITLDLKEDKNNVVNPVNQILIEDSQSNAIKWRNAGGICVLLDLSHSDFANDIVSDINDIFETDSVKRLLKTRQ